MSACMKMCMYVCVVPTALYGILSALHDDGRRYFGRTAGAAMSILTHSLTFVSMRRRLYGVAAQNCYRSYLGEFSHRPASSVATYPLQPLLLNQYCQCSYPSLPCHLLPQGPRPPPYVLSKKRRTTIRCPDKWLGRDCCARVLTRRRLYGVAAQYCYRSYLGESPRRPASSVTVHPLQPLPPRQ